MSAYATSSSKACRWLTLNRQWLGELVGSIARTFESGTNSISLSPGSAPETQATSDPVLIPSTRGNYDFSLDGHISRDFSPGNDAYDPVTGERKLNCKCSVRLHVEDLHVNDRTWKKLEEAGVRQPDTEVHLRLKGKSEGWPTFPPHNETDEQSDYMLFALERQSNGSWQTARLLYEYPAASCQLEVSGQRFEQITQSGKAIKLGVSLTVWDDGE